VAAPSLNVALALLDHREKRARHPGCRRDVRQRQAATLADRAQPRPDQDLLGLVLLGSGCVDRARPLAGRAP
jgi:hypothetical protein